MEGTPLQEGYRKLAHIKGIIFLLDDVLYDQQDWLLPAICFAAEKLGMDPDKAAVIVDEYTRIHGQADSGIYNHVLLSFGQSDSIMNIRAFIAWLNRYVPAPGSLQPYVGVPDALNQLRFSHELALLAEGNVESHKARLAALDCAGFFRQVGYPDEIDGMKSRLPDERGLRSLIKKMQCKPENIMFVGSNPIKHFATPNRLGLTTVRCMTGEYSKIDNAEGEKAAMYCITSAARLPGLLEVDQPGLPELNLSYQSAGRSSGLDGKARA